MSTPDTTLDTRFSDPAATAAGELVAAGTETGLQVAVLRHGRVLADVVSGVADPQTAQPVSHGTLFYAASTAKGVAALPAER